MTPVVGSLLADPKGREWRVTCVDWSARNPLFWYALALVHETPHPQLCGECRHARIGGDGKPCGCADGSGRVYVHCTATVAK